MNLKYTCSLGGSREPLQTPVVFVVDGDTSVRESVDTLIRCSGWQPRSFGSAEEFLAEPRALRPGCLLSELYLPGMSGLDLQARVSERTEMPSIFMSTHADIHAVVRAMKGGAFEFLTKPLSPDVLRNALRGAIERSHVELRRFVQIRALRDRYDLLSQREREVMGLLVRGRLNKQVGGELGISEITVKAHRGRMMRKMQASSFAELVMMATNLHIAFPAS